MNYAESCTRPPLHRAVSGRVTFYCFNKRMRTFIAIYRVRIVRLCYELFALGLRKTVERIYRPQLSLPFFSLSYESS
mgnify:CR=1 FL=1